MLRLENAATPTDIARVERNVADSVTPTTVAQAADGSLLVVDSHLEAADPADSDCSVYRTTAAAGGKAMAAVQTAAALAVAGTREG